MRNPEIKKSRDMALSINLVSAKDLEDMMAFMRKFKLKYSRKKAMKSKDPSRKS